MPVQDKATLVLAGEKEGIGKKKLTDTNLGSEVIEKLSPSSDSSSNLIFPAVDPADEEILSLIGINSHTTTEEKQQKNLDTLEPYDLDESQFDDHWYGVTSGPSTASNHWYGVTSGPLLWHYFSVRLLREIMEGKTLGNE